MVDFDLMTKECSSIGNFAAKVYYNHARKSTITTIATIEAANLYKDFIENVYPICIKKMVNGYYAELIQKLYVSKKEWEEVNGNIDDIHLSMNFCLAFVHPKEREEKYSIRFADHPDIGYENGIVFSCDRKTAEALYYMINEFCLNHHFSICDSFSYHTYLSLKFCGKFIDLKNYYYDELNKLLPEEEKTNSAYCKKKTEKILK